MIASKLKLLGAIFCWLLITGQALSVPVNIPTWLSTPVIEVPGVQQLMIVDQGRSLAIRLGDEVKVLNLNEEFHIEEGQLYEINAVVGWRGRLHVLSIEPATKFIEPALEKSLFNRKFLRPGQQVSVMGEFIITI
ncbi:hypothetical protein [Pseudobacteriovorax antillogorgiicola]|uniref:Uncharacterized protein n=1 Tax=Pseudobacteriovorax antillogorgiicola TaxID=1513793 RepID=A0A1Y6BHZ8_9BACT|nr:hypothetical protein [Pseudobacteriovorax antillogorgiicola]TCS56501.1 hypothetical protein EDD56_104323 [Pseudobacteriovorax antillogorgiicola]SMF04673.1 hypothetical protein SAMN06296036_10410 [Pseudobacteriovorax antillogorgiicola]